MPVKIKAVREREPWGPGAWYAQVVHAVTGAVLMTTDFAPRGVALREAERAAKAQGMEVRPC